MGCSVYGRLIVGIEANEGHFWRNVSTGRTVCAAGHQQKDPSFNNCPQCGRAFSPEVLECPTDAFEAYCKRQGRVPEAVWEGWREAWEDGDLGLHAANAVTSSEDDDPMRVFGKILHSTEDGLEGTGGEISMTPRDIQSECAGLSALASELGFAGAAKVYLSLSTSC